MRKLIAIGTLLVILTVFVSAASAYCPPGRTCATPSPINIPTPQTPGGSFNTYSAGSFTGSVGASSFSNAEGCDVISGSNTKITQVGNGGLAETVGYAGAAGSNANAYSESMSGGSGDFTGSGSATGTAQ